jgi:CubicO group peptidase (beta-lactamase class C family)
VQRIAPPPLPAAAATPHQPSPLDAACSRLAQLRAEEGAEALPSPAPLRLDAAAEHFRRADAFGFSGGVRILEGGQVQLSRAYGFADHVRRLPMSEDAVFNIGSVAKQFTAAAILRLEELGKLKTSDPIGSVLPDVPEDKREITIHQLLSHQAGFRHSVPDLARTPDRDAAVREHLASQLIHRPGRFSYSNVGYALLAAIVDRLSGSGYEAFLREELWLPLGMTRTGMVLPDWRTAQIADGMEFMGSLSPRIEAEWGETGTTWLSRGAGGMDSTMPDLTRWAEALRTGAVLSDASRRKLFWPHARMKGKDVSYYAYGWGIGFAADGSCVVEHNGGGGTHYDVLTIFPQQAVVAATFNTQQKSPWSVRDNFVESLTPVLTGTTLLAGSPLSLPAAIASPAPRELAGIYALPSGERFRLVSENGKLLVPMDNVAALRLFAPWPRAAADATAALGDRAALVLELMSAISTGNYKPLIARLPADIPPPDEVQFWSDYWPRLISKMGPYRGAELIDTVTVEGAPRTLVRLIFDRASTIVAIVHRPEGKAFVDVIPRAFYPQAYLAPLGPGAFQAYYPTTRRGIRVASDSGTLVIQTEAEQVTARRVAVP